ncbi:MAG: lipocalin [Chlorobiaceae bacterium]|nr:lipocalin [Chlorobiaceae bacterium]
MKFIICLILMVIISASLKAQDKSKQPLEVVPSVDLARYCGMWYEIARLPNGFQTKCAGDVVATYTLLDDGQIKVVNRCQKEDGEVTEAEGRAKRASDDEPNSKLKVRFAPAILSFLPFVWGNYWVLEIDTAYTYAVIGEPDREYLWVLSRTPKMDENIIQGILGRMKERGFDVAKIMRTKQTQ